MFGVFLLEDRKTEIVVRFILGRYFSVIIIAIIAVDQDLVHDNVLPS